MPSSCFSHQTVFNSTECLHSPGKAFLWQNEHLRSKTAAENIQLHQVKCKSCDIANNWEKPTERFVLLRVKSLDFTRKEKWPVKRSCVTPSPPETVAGLCSSPRVLQFDLHCLVAPPPPSISSASPMWVSRLMSIKNTSVLYNKSPEKLKHSKFGHSLAGPKKTWKRECQNSKY